MSNYYDQFFDNRNQSLLGKFTGRYKAKVVETNDPLNIGRVKFICPELHDSDMSAEDAPWAVPALDLGGKNAGRFVSPVIGDWIWITFEKAHPYGPVWDGFVTITRKQQYAFPQVHNITPKPFDEEGNLEQTPNDYDLNYLPKDGRPMAHGWVDRYGHMDLSSSVGYYPSEHATKEPPISNDGVSNQAFTQLSAKPEVNAPDKKYMARVTKYGHIFLMGDQGYHWQKEDQGFFESVLNYPVGEFTGDIKKDKKFEYKRWLYLQKLLNDNNPNASDDDGDQRKMIMVTRYGSRFEMRDTGWAQYGPIQSTSRENEYGEARVLSKEENNDFRWIKLRTKGGMLFQMYDKGSHPQEDKFVKRTLLEESGTKSEKESTHFGGNKDARFIRLVSRYGYKLVLDDRGSDERDASGKESPYGNGVLIKGRRTPSAKAEEVTGNPRGFFLEFNENNQANHLNIGSPLGQIIELNDRYQYMMLSVALGENWGSKYRGLEENEFIRKPSMLGEAETASHHLKLDHDNEYVRLKTRGNKGKKPKSGVNDSGVGRQELQQGLEARDGQNEDGPWVELVDCQHRGFWFSKKYNIGIWRSKEKKSMYQWIDENSNKIVIYNNEENGTIEIYSRNTISIVSDTDINLRADRNINMKASQGIRMHAGPTKFTIAQNIQSNANINSQQFRGRFVGVMPGPGAGQPFQGGVEIERLEPPQLPENIEPKDRGKTYNGPFEECPISEVEHEIRQ